MRNRNNQGDLEFDVALSFAGEDRGYVKPIAERLRDGGVSVFYDECARELIV